jgi:hypothetical protein
VLWWERVLCVQDRLTDCLFIAIERWHTADTVAQAISMQKQRSMHKPSSMCMDWIHTECRQSLRRSKYPPLWCTLRLLRPRVLVQAMMFSCQPTTPTTYHSHPVATYRHIQMFHIASVAALHDQRTWTSQSPISLLYRRRQSRCSLVSSRDGQCHWHADRQHLPEAMYRCVASHRIASMH